MDEDLWQRVDDYIGDHVGVHDDALDGALSRSTDAGLPSIAVSPPQGKLLNILATTIGARRILEIGTLGGYSTIWLARALPSDGRLITCEYSEKHAKVVNPTSSTRASRTGSTFGSVLQWTRFPRLVGHSTCHSSMLTKNTTPTTSRGR